MSDLKLQMSQVRGIAENKIQEAMADQVTIESEIGLCVFVECCSHLTNIQNF